MMKLRGFRKTFSELSAKIKLKNADLFHFVIIPVQMEMIFSAERNTKALHDNVAESSVPYSPLILAANLKLKTDLGVALSLNGSLGVHRRGERAH